MTNKENAFISIDAFLFPVLAFSFLVFPVKWILGWVVAIAVHECCHYIALRLLSVQIWNVYIGLFGAKMHTDSMPAFTEFLCALAGPLGSLLLLFLSKQFPYVAICALSQCIFNLLPVNTLDGGRMLCCIVSLFLREETAQKVCRITSNTIQFLLIIGILYLILKQRISVIVALPVLCLLIHFISREKHLAKRAK